MRRADAILLAGILCAGAGCGESGASFDREVPVRTVIVEPGPISQTIIVPCRLEGAEQAVLSVVTPASVTGVFVREGDRVEEGDILVSLETDGMHDAEIDGAAAGVTAAAAALEYQGSRLERTAALFETGAVSQSAYEQAEAAERSASATAGLAQAGYNLALSEASLGQVRAPFSGTITSVWARTGNPASGNLVAMTGGSVLQAALQMAPLRSGELTPGLPVFLETPLFPGELFEGAISSVSPSIDPLSGLLTARAQFSDPDGKLCPGMGCTAMVALVTESEAIIVPQSAMERTDEGSWRVAVVECGTARFRDVQVGIRSGFCWQIVSGLSQGDTLVLIGLNTIVDGSRVREAGE
jgi:membrane fusion protein, multidrug efflux system